MFRSNNAQLDKLMQLSTIISNEKAKLVPNREHLEQDYTSRANFLWYKYFSEGICLATDGVEESFIGLSELLDNPNLNSFNLYNNDQTPLLNQQNMKHFLIEEGAISAKDEENLVVTFALGGHEGLTRVARCLYRLNHNDGVFFPANANGRIAAALNDMKPFGYRIDLLKTDANEKIDINDLAYKADVNPSIKTLFIELKTMSGCVYSTKELKEIISFCHQRQIFLIVNAAHSQMELNSSHAIPNVSELCLQLDFHAFSIIYTGSQTYGLERGRAGFILFSSQNSQLTLRRLDNELTRTFGTINDLPVTLAHRLVISSIENRQAFISRSREKHKYNLNLMLAYIEGVNSPSLDEDFRLRIKSDIDSRFQDGIKGLRIKSIPVCGIHLKIDISELLSKYYTNIRMINAEIFSYTLNKIAGVVTLHSFQFMDSEGLSLRLSFSSKAEIHKGMQSLHIFVNSLANAPALNRYLTDMPLIEESITNSCISEPGDNRVKSPQL